MEGVIIKTEGLLSMVMIESFSWSFMIGENKKSEQPKNILYFYFDQINTGGTAI